MYWVAQLAEECQSRSRSQVENCVLLWYVRLSPAQWKWSKIEKIPRGIIGVWRHFNNYLLIHTVNRLLFAIKFAQKLLKDIRLLHDICWTAHNAKYNFGPSAATTSFWAATFFMLIISCAMWFLIISYVKEVLLARNLDVNLWKNLLFFSITGGILKTTDIRHVLTDENRLYIVCII